MHDIYHISGKFDIVKVGQIPTLRILTKCSRGAYIRNVLIFCTHCNGLNRGAYIKSFNIELF